jgi:hypothetical protein
MKIVVYISCCIQYEAIPKIHKLSALYFNMLMFNENFTRGFYLAVVQKQRHGVCDVMVWLVLTVCSLVQT